MLESPLNRKEIKPVNPKGNQSWIFTGRTDAETEASILWPPDSKSQFIGKSPNAGEDWKQDEKGTMEDEMVGWHHWLNDMNLSKLRETEMDREAWCAAVHGITKSWTWLSDWTTTIFINMDLLFQETIAQELKNNNCIVYFRNIEKPQTNDQFEDSV